MGVLYFTHMPLTAVTFPPRSHVSSHSMKMFSVTGLRPQLPILPMLVKETSEPVDPLASCNAMLNLGLSVVVIVQCTTGHGPNTCLNAPDTKCLMASSSVSFCDGGGCGGSCNQFASCGVPIDNGFCQTPGTSSILVPFL
jgi:hypothetical protein